MEVKDNRPSLLNRIIENPKLALLSLAALTLIIAGLVWVSFSGAPRLASPKDNPYAAARKNQSSKLSLFAWNLTPGWAKELARNIFSWGGSSAWADNLDAQSLARKNGFGLKGGKGSRDDGGEYREGGGPGGTDGEFGEGGEWEIGPDGQKRRRAGSRGGGDYSASATGPGSFGDAGGSGGTRGGRSGAYAGSARFDGIGMAGAGRTGGRRDGADGRAGTSGRTLGRRGATNKVGLGVAKALIDDAGKKGEVEDALPEKPGEFKPGTPPTKLTRASPGEIASVSQGVSSTRELVQSRDYENLRVIRGQFSRIYNTATVVQGRTNTAVGVIRGDINPLKIVERTMLAVPKKFGKYGLGTARDIPNLPQMLRLAQSMSDTAKGLDQTKASSGRGGDSARDRMNMDSRAHSIDQINSRRTQSILSQMNMETAFSDYADADPRIKDMTGMHREKIDPGWKNTIDTAKELAGLIKNTLVPKEIRLRNEKAALESALSACQRCRGRNCGSCNPIKVQLDKTTVEHEITKYDLAEAKKDFGIVDDSRKRFSDQNTLVSGRPGHQNSIFSGPEAGIHAPMLNTQKAMTSEQQQYAEKARSIGGINNSQDAFKDTIKGNDLELDRGDADRIVALVNVTQKDLTDTQKNMQNAADSANSLGSPVYSVRASQNSLEAMLHMREEELQLKLHEEAAIKQQKEDERAAKEFAKQEAARKRFHDEKEAAYNAAVHARCVATSVSGAACP